MASPSFTQVASRGRNDDGSESGASWIAAQNTNWTQRTGVNFRIRFLIDETNSRAWTSKTWNLYYAKNGGTYGMVGGSTAVKFALSSNFADGDDCTSQLTGGSGTFVTNNNGMKEATGGCVNSGSAGNYFETEWCLTIDASLVVNGDYFDFQIYDSGLPIASYTNTPRVTADKPVSLSKASITATGRQIYPDNGIRKLNTAVLTAKAWKACVPFGIVLDIDHEGGTEGEWTGETDPDSDLSVTAGAALAGTNYGLQGVVDDSTAFYKYADSPSSQATGFVQLRFYIDISGMVIDAEEEILFVSLTRGDYAETARVYIYRTSGNYYLYAGAIDDFSALRITDTYQFSSSNELCVEIRMIRAETSTSSDGSITLWLDGSLQETVSGIDNYDRFTEFERLLAGAISGGSFNYPGTAGTFFLDEFVVRDDGQYIGPKTTGINISLAKAALTATGRPITLSLGAVSVSLSNAAATATGRTITVSAPPPETTVNLQRGQATATGQAITVVPGARTVSVNQAIATATGRTTTVVKGAVTVTLSRGIATATGGAIKVNYAVNLAKGTATATGGPVSVVPGAKTVSVNAGILTATGLQINVLRPIYLLTAQATVTGRPITLSLGAVTKSLNTAQATAQGRVITVVPGAKTITLTTATATALGRAITVSAPPPGAINIPLSTAQATATGRAIKINYAVNLARGQAAATGQVIKINYAVNLTRAQATATGRVITVVKGTATVSLSRGIATATGRVITVSAPPPSPITVSLYTAQAAATGRAITVLKGTATIQLDEAQAVAVGRSAVIVKGAVTKALARGILTATGRTITVINVVGISVSLDTAQATASGRALTVLPGAKSVALNTGSLTATGRPITFSMGAVAVVLACGALAASGRTIKVDSPGPITHAPYLTLLERDRELTVEIRDRELTLFLRSIYLSLEETR